MLALLALLAGGLSMCRAGPTVVLTSGPVHTARSIPMASRPHHLGRVLAHSNTQLWLLTLPIDKQQQLYDTLSSQPNTKVLHSLPGTTHAWLVHADEGTIQTVVDTHDYVTVAQLPAHSKLSRSLAKVLTTLSEEARLPSTHDLDGYDTQQGTDGSVAVTLQVTLGHTGDVSLDSYISLLQSHLAQMPLQQEVLVTAELGGIQLSVGLKDLRLVSEWLSSQPEVLWVGLVPNMQLHDLYSVAAMQAPRQIPSSSYPAPDVTGGTYRPYWNAGLDGTGQIVGVTDSGLDMDSCFVQDPGTSDGTGFRARAIPVSVRTTAGIGVVTRRAYQNRDARKVVAYIIVADNRDDTVSSHGTHVVTSIVGLPAGEDPLSTATNAVGAAPGARVAFMDVSSTSRDGSTDGVFRVPPLVMSSGWTIMKDMGVAVTSNSWGAIGPNAFEYTSEGCRVMDSQGFNEIGMLNIFSAGNSGARPAGTTGTVSYPAVCKNVMSVGAAENYVWGGVEKTYIKQYTSADGPYLGPRQAQGLVFTIVNSEGYAITESVVLTGSTGSTCQLPGSCDVISFVNVLPALWTVSNFTQVVILSCPISSASFAGISDTTPLIVLMDFNLCTNAEKRSALNTLNIVALLQYSTVNDSPPPPAPSFDDYAPPSDYSNTAPEPPSQTTQGTSVESDSDLPGSTQLPGWWTAGGNGPTTVGTAQLQADRIVSFGQAFITPSGWSKIQNLIGQASGVLIAAWNQPNASDPLPWENVADFSSIGSPLAFDKDTQNTYYRIKPDVTAPGWIEAGVSDGKQTGNAAGTLTACNSTTTILAGTSMATPQVASAALIVRQYFMDGFYPTGSRVSSNGFTPSGPLIRAVLTAGTVAMRGASAINGQPLAPPPSQYQGFGRVDLSNTLPLAGQSNFNIKVFDLLNATLDAPSYTSTITVTAAGQPLVVVLVWHDPPAFPGAASSYVNNLDLSVTSPGGTKYYPNGRTTPDPVNNVEKVFIQAAEAGQYTIQVEFTYLSIPDSPNGQPFALVVRGALNQSNPVTSDPLAAPPSPPRMPSFPGFGRSPPTITTLPITGGVPRTIPPRSAASTTAVSWVMTAVAGLVSVLCALGSC